MGVMAGTVGQMYENRKTKKSGVLVGKDEAKKTLQLNDSVTGEEFEVSEVSFRSNWRRAISENLEPVKKEIPVAPFSNKDAIESFIREVGAAREIRFTANPELSDITELVVDNITAMRLEKCDGKVWVTVLPDLYTYSDIKNHIHARSIRFSDTAPLSVSFLSNYTEFGEVLQAVKEAVIELNLYGYTVE